MAYQKIWKVSSFKTQGYFKTKSISVALFINIPFLDLVQIFNNRINYSRLAIISFKKDPRTSTTYITILDINR